MANSMQRTFNRRSPVKVPRDSSGARSSNGNKAPFRDKKNSVVSAQPAIGDKGSFTQREKYVTGDNDYMST